MKFRNVELEVVRPGPRRKHHVEKDGEKGGEKRRAAAHEVSSRARRTASNGTASPTGLAERHPRG